jgi:hypothetical protein
MGTRELDAQVQRGGGREEVRVSQNAQICSMQCCASELSSVYLLYRFRKLPACAHKGLTQSPDEPVRFLINHPKRTCDGRYDWL